VRPLVVRRLNVDHMTEAGPNALICRRLRPDNVRQRPQFGPGPPWGGDSGLKLAPLRL